MKRTLSALLLCLLLAAPAWAVPAPEPRPLPGPVDIVGEWAIDWHPGWELSAPELVRFHPGGWGQALSSGYWRPFAWERTAQGIVWGDGEHTYIFRLHRLTDGGVAGTGQIDGQAPQAVRLVRVGGGGGP